MKTWKNFKKEASEKNAALRDDIEEMDLLADIVTSIVEKRKKLGYSQRDLAVICNLPQSSVARIETYKVSPNIGTLLKIMRPLGLTLSVVNL